jgi:hypothetical protein
MKPTKKNAKKTRSIATPSTEGPDSGIEVEKTTGVKLIDEVAEAVRESTGTYSEDVGCRLTYQASRAQVWPKDEEDDLVTALQFMREIAPQNAVEAMLAVQMMAAHEAGLMFPQRSTLKDQPSNAIDANVCRATRLFRIFGQQVEAMQKLKGKAGPPTLTVEQVNVHQGGQAIVGSVSASKEGG